MTATENETTTNMSKTTYNIIIIFLVVLFCVFNSYFLNAQSAVKSGEYEIIRKIKVDGAEDITVSLEGGFAIVSATNREEIPATKNEIGGLYYLDLKDKSYALKNLTASLPFAFAPHGISMFPSGNGYNIVAINHTIEGDFIEVFYLEDEKLKHIKTLEDDLISTPNDLVLIDEERFYFSNDHFYEEGFMRIVEDAFALTKSNVVFYDGKNYREVADNISYSNGINYDKNRALIFVSSPRKKRVKVYTIDSKNDLNFVENIKCKTGVDNIEFDPEMNLWIGAHPSPIKFARYALGRIDKAPSEVIKINYKGKKDYAIESVYTNDGSEMSGSSVAAPYNDLILVGNVMDDHFIILKKKKSGR